MNSKKKNKNRLANLNKILNAYMQRHKLPSNSSHNRILIITSITRTSISVSYDTLNYFVQPVPRGGYRKREGVGICNRRVCTQFHLQLNSSVYSFTGMHISSISMTSTLDNTVFEYKFYRKRTCRKITNYSTKSPQCYCYINVRTQILKT